MDDNKGTFLLLALSIKGNKILEAISNQQDCVKLDLDESSKEYPNSIKSTLINKTRVLFIVNVFKEGFKQKILINFGLISRISKIEEIKFFFVNCKNKFIRTMFKIFLIDY